MWKNENKQGNRDMSEGKDVLKFVKSLRLHCNSHIEQNPNPRNVTINSRSYSEGNKKNRKDARKMEK